MNRPFELLVSISALLLLSPLLLLLAVLVRLTSPGPALHRARRVGRGGIPFTLFKFRSMTVGAPGPRITARDDPRITPLGAALRRTKLDELPQLFNILKGDMSLVGPRPEDPAYIPHYTPAQRRVLDVRPGITSPASLHYRHEEHLLAGPDWETVYLEKILPEKLRLELAYLETRTFRTDLALIWATALSLFHKP